MSETQTSTKKQTRVSPEASFFKLKHAAYLGVGAIGLPALWLGAPKVLDAWRDAHAAVQFAVAGTAFAGAAVGVAYHQHNARIENQKKAAAESAEAARLGLRERRKAVGCAELLSFGGTHASILRPATGSAWEKQRINEHSIIVTGEPGERTTAPVYAHTRIPAHVRAQLRAGQQFDYAWRVQADNERPIILGLLQAAEHVRVEVFANAPVKIRHILIGAAPNTGSTAARTLFRNAVELGSRGRLTVLWLTFPPAEEETPQPPTEADAPEHIVIPGEVT